jgi:hypothetical protein
MGVSAPQDAVVRSAVRVARVLLCVAALTKASAAEPGSSTPQPATAPIPPPSGPSRSTAAFRTSADLDDTYLWIGPGGGAAWIDDEWYSTFGGAATVVRVREASWLGAAGISVGAARWTERDGGRVWVDGLVGTRRLVPWTRTMIGASLGPMLELGDLHHPKIGASGSIWVFAGVVPYLRLGVVDAAGGFLEAGIQVSLPAVRW